MKKEKKEKPIKIHKKAKLGIAFGGGGAQGLVHIGAIMAFRELGIDFDYVAGTSVGSLVGALYAGGISPETMAETVKNLKVKDIRDSSLIFKPSKPENIEKLVNKVFGKEIVFSELKKPFAAVCTNLKTGEEMVFKAGSVAKVVSGSCAVPAIFNPVVYQDMHLVDGGLLNNVPANVVRDMGANIIVAIELNYKRGHGTENTNLTSVLLNSIGIMMSKTVEMNIDSADIVIQPDLSAYKSTNLDNREERIKIGYDCVMACKDQLLQILKRKPKKINGKKNSIKYKVVSD